jgi:sugar phosphate isomerase/epimerase
VYRLPIAVQLDSFRLPLRKALVEVSKLRVQGVEIDASGELKPRDLTPTAVREVRSLLAEADVAVAAVRFRSRNGFSEPDGLDRRVDAARQTLKMASELRAPVVTCALGDIPPESDGDAWKLLVEVLSELGQYGARIGSLLAAQTGFAPADDLARLIAALPDGMLGIDFDPAQLMMNNESPTETIATLGPFVHYFHAKDGARDFARRTGLETQLGRGSVDFPAVLAALEQRAYRGYVCITSQANEPTTELTQAIQFLRSLG